MSLKERFEAIKAAIFHATNYADPAAVLEKAEHEFKEGVIAEFEAMNDRFKSMHDRVKELEDKVFGKPEVPEFSATVVLKEHQPGEVNYPNAQPEVAQNTGSGAAPVDPLGSTASDSAGVYIPAAGTAPEQPAA